MKVFVVSYSMTGNNQALAARLAETLSAEQVQIAEPKSRSMLTIVLDILLNRTPKIAAPVEKVEQADFVLFCGPVWMGQAATPFRACFKQLGSKIGRYGFVSICGGADGPNPKLAGELEARLGTKPACLVELHLADLLPPEPKPTRNDTMGYRITDEEANRLADQTVSALRPVLESEGG